MFSSIIMLGFLLAAPPAATGCPCQPVCACEDCRCDLAAADQSACPVQDGLRADSAGVRSCKPICACRPCTCAGGNCSVQAASAGPTAKCQCKPECKCAPCRCGEKCPAQTSASTVAGPTAKCQCKPECKCDPCRCGEKCSQASGSENASDCPCGEACSCLDCRCCASGSPCAECRCGGCAAGACSADLRLVASRN